MLTKPTLSRWQRRNRARPPVQSFRAPTGSPSVPSSTQSELATSATVRARALCLVRVPTTSGKRVWRSGLPGMSVALLPISGGIIVAARAVDSGWAGGDEGVMT